MKSNKRMDVIDVTLPMRIITIIFFISPYQTSKLNNNKTNRRSFIFSKALFAVNVVSMLFYLFQNATWLPKIMNDSVIKGALRVSLIFAIFYYITIIIMSNVLHRRQLVFLNDLIEIDQIFESLYIHPNDFTSKMILFAFTALASTSFSSILVLLNSVIIGEFGFVSLIYMYRSYVSHVRVAVLLQFACYVFLLYYRFKVLNDRLKVYKSLYGDASPKFKKRLMSSVRICCLLHNRLVLSCDLLNSAFELQVTTTLVFVFWYVVPLLNILIKSKFDILQTLFLFMSYIIKIVIFVMCIAVTAFVCTKTKNKVGSLAYLSW